MQKLEIIQGTEKNLKTRPIFVFQNFSKIYFYWFTEIIIQWYEKMRGRREYS